MKTLLIAQDLRPPWASGAISYAKGVLSSLLRITGNEISIISTLDNHRASNTCYDDWKVVGNFREHSVNYVQLGGPSDRDQKRLVFAVTRSLDSVEKFDVIHLIYRRLTPFEMVFRNTVSKKAMLIKHIYVPASSYFNASTTSWIYNVGLLNGFPNIMVSFPSYYSASTYWMHFNRHSVLIPPAIDTDFFTRGQANRQHEFNSIFSRALLKFGIENLTGKSKLILYMGWLIPQRFPYERILRAFKKTLATFPRQELGFLIVGRQQRLYGERETAESIIGLAQRLEIDKNIGVALHELSESDKLSLLNRSDVLIYPFASPHLNPPVVDPPLGILEAMASEKKVLASHLLSIPNVIRNEFNGFLLENHDVDGITKSLNTAIGVDNNIGKNARETVIRRFSLPAIADILGKISISR